MYCLNGVNRRKSNKEKVDKTFSGPHKYCSEHMRPFILKQLHGSLQILYFGLILATLAKMAIIRPIVNQDQNQTK